MSAPKFKTKVRVGLAVAFVAGVAIIQALAAVLFVDPDAQTAFRLIAGVLFGLSVGPMWLELPRTLHREHMWGPTEGYIYVKTCDECGAWK